MEMSRALVQTERFPPRRPAVYMRVQKQNSAMHFNRDTWGIDQLKRWACGSRNAGRISPFVHRANCVKGLHAAVMPNCKHIPWGPTVVVAATHVSSPVTSLDMLIACIWRCCDLGLQHAMLQIEAGASNWTQETPSGCK
jgi:hypothetical protein